MVQILANRSNLLHPQTGSLESCGPGQTFWGSKGFSLVFALLLMQQKMFFTLDLNDGVNVFLGLLVGGVRIPSRSRTEGVCMVESSGLVLCSRVRVAPWGRIDQCPTLTGRLWCRTPGSGCYVGRFYP